MPTKDIYHEDIDPEAEQSDENFEDTQDDPLMLSIEDSLDLHTFRPGEVSALLDDYLEAASAKGFQEVLIIHGRGQGILRQYVNEFPTAISDCEYENGTGLAPLDTNAAVHAGA